MVNTLAYISIVLCVLILATIRYSKKKIKLFNFIILIIGAFIPVINTGLLCSYIFWVVLLKQDKINYKKNL